MSTTEHIDKLKAILSEEVPYCIGTVLLNTDSSKLFYRNTADESSGFIDFSTAVSNTQLQNLVQACQPATFGVQQKDVLDESYRRAWKMDTVNFATHFDPNNTGIIQAIHDLLLKDPNASIRVELHKLNVYGPGSFFKGHVDTPRSSEMFGSLVVVLPTEHEGGTLLLRHHGREWTFNSADIVSPQNAAFIAFFGDVEHEVSVVNSGYRVTLTYNLYFGDNRSSAFMLPTSDTEVQIRRSLLTLLNDDKFLPDGGLLGFSLSHLYPINLNTKLDKLGDSLKGTDAAIKRACNSLSLQVFVKAFVNSWYKETVACLLADVTGLKKVLNHPELSDDVAFYLKEHSPSSLIVYDMMSLKPQDIHEIGCPDASPILWLKPLTERHQVEAPYVRYGNQATLNYVYGKICLVVKVEPFKNRQTYHG